MPHVWKWLFNQVPEVFVYNFFLNMPDDGFSLGFADTGWSGQECSLCCLVAVAKQWLYNQCCTLWGLNKSVPLMLIHVLFHVTLSLIPWWGNKMLFTSFFNVLSHTLTQLLVMTLCQSGFVYQVHVFLSFFFVCQITVLILQHLFSWSPNFLQCISNN